MKIALPVSNGVLCNHFGHCDQFAIADVDAQAKSIKGIDLVEPPPHEPGLLPRWLYEKGVNLVIAGGMGARARDLFEQKGIKVVVGARPANPEDLVMDYLKGVLVSGANVCDH